MVSTGQQKDELRVAGLQHGAAVEQSLSEERFAERQCAGLGNDGLVQVEKGRGAGSRSGASRCLRWGLPLGGRVGDGHRPSIGRQLDRPATLFPNRSIDYRCCREVKSIYTAQAVLSIASGTCVTAHCHVYSKHYSAIAEGVSVRPPGADARRPSPPPPWRGSSLLAATQTSSARCLAQLSGRCGNRVARTPSGAFVHSCTSVPNCAFGTGVPHHGPRTVGG